MTKYGKDAIREKEDSQLVFKTKLRTVGIIVAACVILGSLIYYTS